MNPWEFSIESIADHYVDALIEIATAFETNIERRWEVARGVPVPNGCFCCHQDFEDGCDDHCPGLFARRVLGVA